MTQESRSFREARQRSLDNIVRAFDLECVESIILWGSAASDHWVSGSDVDLVLFLNRPFDHCAEELRAARRALPEFNLDILCTEFESIREWPQKPSRRLSNGRDWRFSALEYNFLKEHSELLAGRDFRPALPAFDYLQASLIHVSDFVRHYILRILSLDPSRNERLPQDMKAVYGMMPRTLFNLEFKKPSGKKEAVSWVRSKTDEVPELTALAEFLESCQLLLAQRKFGTKTCLKLWPQFEKAVRAYLGRVLAVVDVSNERAAAEEPLEAYIKDCFLPLFEEKVPYRIEPLR